MPKRDNVAMVSSTHHPAIQRAISKGAINKGVLNIGNEQGLNVHFQRFEQRLDPETTALGFGKVIRFKIPPSYCDFVTGLRVLLTLTGPPVDAGATATNLSYPAGINSLFSKITYKQGGNVFYTQDGDLETVMHEFDRHGGEYDRHEVTEGFGSVAEREAQLGSSYTYILEQRMTPFNNGGGAFALRACNAPIYIEFLMQPALIDSSPAATGAITGVGIEAFQLDIHCLNVPPALMRATTQMVNTGDGIEQIVLEPHQQVTTIASGASDYSIQLDQFPGVSHGLAWVMRNQSDLTSTTQYRPSNYSDLVSNWHLLHNNVDVLNDHGEDTNWKKNDYLHKQLGAEITNAPVHAHFFGVAPEPSGLFAGGISSGHFVFNPHDNYQLTFRTSSAVAATSDVNVWSFNYIIVRTKQGRVQRVTK